MTLDGARFLISGVVLGQPMGGVRRHNAELLPRVAALLYARGASLSILEGRTPIAFELPPFVQRVACDVPAGPPLRRALVEGRTVRATLEQAQLEGRPFRLFHTAHLPLPRGLALPVTVTLHDLRRLDATHASPLRRASARFALRRAAQSASRLFCVSEAVREELVTQLDIERSRVTRLGNAADHLAVQERCVTENSPILCVGHLERRKNLELLLHALALDASLPDLVLAGASKGHEAQRLKALATELGLEQRVRFHGAFEESALASLLASAACCVQPSLIEGFGIGVLESQRAGVPLALSEIPAHREVSGGHAAFFAPDDAAACAAALRAARLASGESLTAARQSAERYSWDRIAERWVEAWTEVIRA